MVALSTLEEHPGELLVSWYKEGQDIATFLPLVPALYGNCCNLKIQQNIQRRSSFNESNLEG
jgi:hypothetical protein